MGSPQIQRRAPAKHKSGSRGYKKIVKGRKEPIPISITAPILPSGTAGTGPDISDILEVALGTHTNTGGTSDAYEFSDTPIVGLTLVHGDAKRNWAEWAFGVLITQIRINAGEEEVMIEFAGMAAGKCSIMAALTNESSELNNTDPTTVVVMATDNAYRAVGLGALLVDADDTDEIMKPTANDDTLWTVAREHLGTKTIHADGFTFEPFMPAQTLNAGAVPLGEQEGSFTLHGKTIYPTAYSFEVNTGLEHRKPEKSSITRRNMLSKPPTVTGSVTLLLDRENAEFFGRAASFVEAALSFVEGDTGGSKFTTDAGIVHCTVPDDVEFPDDGSEIEIELGLELFGWENDESPIRFMLS